MDGIGNHTDTPVYHSFRGLMDAMVWCAGALNGVSISGPVSVLESLSRIVV